MAKRDYYEVLGVARDVGEEDIKRSYRTLAKKYHPDANPGDKKAEEKFKELGEAYEVLSNAQKRGAYDTFGHQATGPGMGPGGSGGFEGFGGSFTNVSDMFEDLLGGFFGGGARSQRRSRQPGEDLRYDLDLTLEEAAEGGERKISFERTEFCSACEGSGAKPGTAPKICPTCNGRGQVQVSHGFFAISRTCHKCRGRGTVIESACSSCRGSGHVKVERTLNVKVPAGVDHGMRVRLPGEGEPGEHGGPRGDLYLAITLRRHELFEREGANLLLNLPVPFTVAATGGEVQVPSLNGASRLKIPAATQPGQLFRLKGQGMPIVDQRGRGDLIVRVLVEIPRRLNSRQKDLLKQFEEEAASASYEEVRKFEEKVRRLPR